MNSKRLLDALKALGNIKVPGAVLLLGDVWGNEPVVSVQFSSGDRVEFVDRLGVSFIPESWQQVVGLRDLAFEGLAEVAIEAARRSLQERACACEWVLSFACLTLQDVDRQCRATTRLEEFQTAAFGVRIEIAALNRYKSNSIGAVGLPAILRSDQVGSLFQSGR